MIHMRVGEINVQILAIAFASQFAAKRAEPSAGVYDNRAVAASDFKAGRIAAITRRCWARGGNTAAHAPKCNRKRVAHPLHLLPAHTRQSPQNRPKGY